LAGDLLAPRQPLHSPREFRTLHASILGHICPDVKRKRVWLWACWRSRLGVDGAGTVTLGSRVARAVIAQYRYGAGRPIRQISASSGPRLVRTGS
jgi:hypothetical protein